MPEAEAGPRKEEGQREQPELELHDLTLFVDAALNTTTNMIGVGAVIFNYRSLLVFHAEALALLVGLRWAENIGLPIKTISSDSLMLVQALNNSKVCHNELGMLLDDIKMLVANFPGAIITHVNRKFNIAAHNLSKQALQLDDELIWMEDDLQSTENHMLFMDLSICPSFFLNRNLGDSLSQCKDTQLIGRLILGLYGNLVPITVSNFKAMCTGTSGSSYKGTLVHKIFPGQFFVAGKQGRKDKGEVSPPVKMVRNLETVSSKAFELRHSKAGVLSLCLSENDDEDDVKLDPNYHNVEFLITTGPGPCPDLDGKNIVFGTVLEGLDVVTSIASIPTYKPGERIRQYNDLAEFFGDERAKTARAIWNKPLETVYISDCGVLKVAKTTLSPTLP
nr:PREDICTED: peptidyl-prolyl cis-trans isomerase CYP28, chloroplastic-like [Daucus carota subsp. sativus]